MSCHREGPELYITRKTRRQETWPQEDTLSFSSLKIKKNPSLVSRGLGCMDSSPVCNSRPQGDLELFTFSEPKGFLINKMTVPIAVRTQMSGMEFQLSASHRASVERVLMSSSGRTALDIWM